MAYGYEEFKADILKYTGIDLNSYKEEQMKRRIDTLILRKSFNNYQNYFEKIKSDASICDEFLSYMTINVSEFFRNPDQWRILEQELLPELLSGKDKVLRVWSAACSTGDEPYSLVMLLSKFIPLDNIQVLATDLDAQILEKASNGLYSAGSLKHVPKEFMKYFTDCGRDVFRISDTIKKHVVFKQHNLLCDPYPRDMDLIVCRNVLIYFTEQAKNDVYKKFYQVMNKPSLLFIGTTEQVMKYREIGFEIYKSFFYKKR